MPCSDDVNQAIATNGDSSPGVLAMSGGGGSGVAFGTDSTAISKTKGSGNGGAVTVNVSQAVDTYGANSHGVIAASYGGGGGLVIRQSGITSVTGSGVGTGGAVAVSIKSGITVTARGKNSTGIWSTSSGGSNDPSVTIEANASVTGGLGGMGVYLGGADNNLENYGTLGTLDGWSGLALISDPGVTRVNNGGRLTGAVQLGSGLNVFNNLEGGVLVAGSKLDLSSTGKLINAGVLQPGGATVGGVTTLTGDLQQLGNGLIQTALGDGGSATRLIVNGNASLAGKLGVFIPSNVIIKEGEFANSLITVNGAFTDAGMSSVSTALVNNKLAFSANGIGLKTSVNFSPAELTTDGQRFGKAIAKLQANGGTAKLNQILHKLVLVEEITTIERTYSHLGGHALSAVVQTGLQAAQSGLNGLAEQATLWRTGAKRPQGKMWQLWVSPSTASENTETSSGRMSANFSRLAMGVDVQLSPNVLIGFGMLGGQNRVQINSSATSSIEGFGAAGFYGAGRFGKAYVSAATYVGVNQANVTRSFVGYGTARNTLDAHMMGARVEAGYTVPLPGLKLTPFVAFEPTIRRQYQASESISTDTGREAGLTLPSQTSSSLPLTTGMQIESDFALVDGSMLSAYFRAGLRHEFDTNRDLTKTLYGSPDATFQSGGDYAALNTAIVRLGVQYKISEQVSFFSDFSTQLSKQSSYYGGWAGFQVRF